jgi:hypothetical protein
MPKNTAVKQSTKPCRIAWPPEARPSAWLAVLSDCSAEKCELAGIAGLDRPADPVGPGGKPPHRTMLTRIKAWLYSSGNAITALMASRMASPVGAASVAGHGI